MASKQATAIVKDYFMRKSSKLLFAGLTAALLLSLAVGSASANRLSTTERRIRKVWTPFRWVFGSSTLSCNLTLDGSFHSATIAKVVNALIGHNSRATLNTCTGGSATVLRETLPWHVQYESFRGTLPRINTDDILVTGMNINLQPTGGLVCVMRSTPERPARFEANLDGTGRIVGLAAEPLRAIPLTGSGGFCAFSGEAHLEGTGVVTRLGETGSVSIRLI